MSQDLLGYSEDLETSGRHVQISQLAKSQASQDLFDESQLTEVDGLSLDLLQEREPAINPSVHEALG